MSEEEKANYEKMDHNSIDYKNYINSPEWLEKRREVFEEYGNHCQACKKDQGSLDVHHRTYKHFREEELSELVPLCRRCHEAIHDRHKSDIKNPTRLSLSIITDYFIAERSIRSNRDVDGYTRISLPKVTDMGSRMAPRKEKRIQPRIASTSNKLKPKVEVEPFTPNQLYFLPISNMEVRSKIVSYIETLGLDDELRKVAIKIALNYDRLAFTSYCQDINRDIAGKLTKVWNMRHRSGIFMLTKNSMLTIFNLELTTRERAVSNPAFLKKEGSKGQYFPPVREPKRKNSRSKFVSFAEQKRQAKSLLELAPTSSDICAYITESYKQNRVSLKEAEVAMKIAENYDSATGMSTILSSWGIAPESVKTFWFWSQASPLPILQGEVYHYIISTKRALQKGI